MWKHFLLLSIISYGSQAQNIIDDLQDNGPTEPSVSDGLGQFSEEVILKSRNRRILILTNQNKSLKQGDFISLFVNDQKIARAIVAKNRDTKVAIKIINTFSDSFDSYTKRGSDLVIVRGDDSAFTSQEKESLTSLEDSELFQSDLFGAEDESKKPSLQENHLITLAIGMHQSINLEKDKEFYLHGIASYALNAAGPFWIEGLYGFSNMQKFPANNISAHLHGVGARIKFNLNLPWHTYFMPYAGVHFAYILSPNTEEPPTSLPVTDPDVIQYNKEVDLITEGIKMQLAAGFTLHKRFVPGWFFTLNGGIDLIYVGVTIGF